MGETQPPVRIEPLAERPDVAEVIARWHWREWSDPASSDTLEEWAATVRDRAGPDDVPFTLVAFVGDRAVGAVSVCWDDVDGEFADRGPWLSGMVVDHRARNLGVGRTLLAAAELRTGRLGHRVLWLHTSEASRFYERLGWQVERVKQLLDRDAVLSRTLPRRTRGS